MSSSREKVEVQVALTGQDEPSILRVLNRNTKLIQELGLRQNQVVVTPAIVESRAARNTEGEFQESGSIGDEADSLASAGQTGAGRGARRRKREAEEENGEVITRAAS